MGRTTDRISGRDLEVLEFVARYGVVPRDAVASWADTKETVTWTRERRLREAGLVRVLRNYGDDGPFVLCTKLGLRVVGCEALGLASFSPGMAHHSAVCARLGAELEGLGHSVLSEREVMARERRERGRSFSAPLSGGRFHRPDLVLENDKPIAVEVELAEKAPGRLDEILRGWRQAVISQTIGAVIYRCGPRAQPGVERAMVRTRVAGKKIRVEELSQPRR